MTTTNTNETNTTTTTQPTKEPKNHTYVVIRYGANGANQSMVDRMAVGFVEAKTKREAWSKAQKTFTFWVNQTCEVVNVNRARRADLDEAFEEERYSCNRY